MIPVTHYSLLFSRFRITIRFDSGPGTFSSNYGAVGDVQSRLGPDIARFLNQEATIKDPKN